MIANGDIRSCEDAGAALAASRADGVMVGRGAQGRPWALAGIAAALFGAPAPAIPEGADRADMVADHYEDMLSFYGRVLGPRVARKHLGWYMDEVGTPAPPAQGHPDGGRAARRSAASARRDLRRRDGGGRMTEFTQSLWASLPVPALIVDAEGSHPRREPRRRNLSERVEKSRSTGIPSGTRSLSMRRWKRRSRASAPATPRFS